MAPDSAAKKDEVIEFGSSDDNEASSDEPSKNSSSRPPKPPSPPPAEMRSAFGKSAPSSAGIRSTRSSLQLNYGFRGGGLAAKDGNRPGSIRVFPASRSRLLVRPGGKMESPYRMPHFGPPRVDYKRFRPTAGEKSSKTERSQQAKRVPPPDHPPPPTSFFAVTRSKGGDKRRVPPDPPRPKKTVSGKVLRKTDSGAASKNSNLEEAPARFVIAFSEEEWTDNETKNSQLPSLSRENKKIGGNKKVKKKLKRKKPRVQK
ncbi:E3 SUMO-protein ligase pli1, variant 2 [Bonamia ostreae]